MNAIYRKALNYLSQVYVCLNCDEVFSPLPDDVFSMAVGNNPRCPKCATKVEKGPSGNNNEIDVLDKGNFTKNDKNNNEPTTATVNNND